MSGMMLPQRYLSYPLAPVGSDRQIPGYPYGMRGMGAVRGMSRGFGDDPASAGPMMQANYPPAPVPTGLPAQSYWALPPSFTHTYGYKDAIAAAGLEFHTEYFELAVDPIAQSGQTIAPGASAIATFRVSQEADFVAEKIMDICNIDDEDTDTGPNSYRAQIFDNATNRALSNIPLPRGALCGTASRPALIKPRLFRRNSDITIVFTANANNSDPITALVFVFQGFKIFDANALNLNNPQ